MHGGLGRHSEAYGEPVSEIQFEVYFKVRQNPPELHMLTTKSSYSDLSAPSDLLLRLGHCDQDVLDPPILPPFRRDSLVPMGTGIYMGRRHTLFHRGRPCRHI